MAGYEGIVQENMTLCVESYIGFERSGEGVKLEEQVLNYPRRCKIAEQLSHGNRLALVVSE